MSDDILGGTGATKGTKRKRDIPMFVWLNQEEHAAILQRMEQAGTQNLSAFIRKMALTGYVLRVDLTPVRELVTLQRRCANNMNQIAKGIHTNGRHQIDVTQLQADYEQLWGKVSDVLQKLTAVVEL